MLSLHFYAAPTIQKSPRGLALAKAEGRELVKEAKGLK